MTRAVFLTSAVVFVSVLAGTRGAVAQAMPDNENGRYTLSPIADGVIRLDTRTGAVSTCSNAQHRLGLLCRARRARRLRSEIGRLQAENEKSKAEVERLKAELASRAGGCRRQDRRSAAEIGLAEKGRAEGGRERAQDRNPAAERPRHGSGDVVPRAGLAAAGRNGQPDAERRQRQDLKAPLVVARHRPIHLPHARLGGFRRVRSYRRCLTFRRRAAALSISRPRSRNSCRRRARSRGR